MNKKKLVVLTGAGISADSGLKTFRDHGGLWENYSIEEVATPESFAKRPELVLDFYNHRRLAAYRAIPNPAHHTLRDLEEHFSVEIITQNVDDLHEKAGSQTILHLHGELRKVRSVADESLIYTIDDKEIKLGDLAEDGQQLRPHIVWFGEAVPMMEKAIEISQNADIFMVVGTSLQVYPAAGLLHYLKPDTPLFLVDTQKPRVQLPETAVFKQGKAAEMLPLLKSELLAFA
ncbi:NAD-dependent deacylase [Marinilongibacter aquaticus]|uniref:Sir2 family NAD-dependent protein deacetylase n=1 Tax=Marinilongibacter aquaticus TaxID=2975157 RepID=UPI0021BD614F|nr:Sir2 family NAD-dependent protein deacetylase [Marinilongibacter aquaticus]UBM58842.1 NAD-dependent deacylase [Marinilongibacter aquaticus]